MADGQAERKKLEKLFERVLIEVGAPIVDAHTLASAGGFTMDKGGLPSGHNSDMVAAGFVCSGLVAVRPSDPTEVNDQGEWLIMKDKEHTWFLSFMMDIEGAKHLADDLYRLISQAESKGD
jgi:hypothetical protein